CPGLAAQAREQHPGTSAFGSVRGRGRGGEIARASHDVAATETAHLDRGGKVCHPEAKPRDLLANTEIPRCARDDIQFPIIISWFSPRRLGPHDLHTARGQNLAPQLADAAFQLGLTDAEGVCLDRFATVADASAELDDVLVR